VAKLLYTLLDTFGVGVEAFGQGQAYYIVRRIC